MHFAESISLCQGISYDNVYIAEKADFDTYNIPRIFQAHERIDMVWDGAIAFWHSGKLILSHASNVRTIKVSSARRKFPQPDNTPFVRLVLNGDIVYEEGVILHSKYHEECGIPAFFADEHDIFDQVVFTCKDGVFATHDINICTIIMEDTTRKFKAHAPAKNNPNTIQPQSIPRSPIKQRKISRS